MKKKILTTLLLAGVITLGSAQMGFAATTATQTLTASLGTMKKVMTNGGTISSSIDTDTGNLVTTFSPGFRIQTNTNSALGLTLTSTCVGGSTQNAIYDRSGTRYIILANATVPPTDAAIGDCKQATPTAAQNANAISYAVTEPSDIAGQLDYTYNATNANWDVSLTHKGQTDTSLSIPAGAAATNTYSYDDEAGTYTAAVTLSFNP